MGVAICILTYRRAPSRARTRSYSRIRRDARACPLAHRRTGQRNAFDCDAGSEAARLAPPATEEEGPGGPTETRIGRRRGVAATILATAILRFQCVESEEASGETRVHAHESGETRVGDAPEAVAVEQFLVLLEIETGIDSHRSREIGRETRKERQQIRSTGKDGKRKTDPSKNREGAGTRKGNCNDYTVRKFNFKG